MLSEGLVKINSNYSSLLVWWDRLHRTFRLNVSQDDIVVAVPAYQEDDHDQMAIERLTLPFRRQKDYWRRPSGGVPDRPADGDCGYLAK